MELPGQVRSQMEFGNEGGEGFSQRRKVRHDKSNWRPLQKSHYGSFRRNELKVARHFSAGKIKEKRRVP